MKDDFRDDSVGRAVSERGQGWCHPALPFSQRGRIALEKLVDSV